LNFIAVFCSQCQFLHYRTAATGNVLPKAQVRKVLMPRQIPEAHWRFKPCRRSAGVPQRRGAVHIITIGLFFGF